MFNHEEDLPLFFSLIRAGEVERAKELIAIGHNVNAAFEDGRTPLISAAHHGHFEIVKLLVEAGADVNAVDAEQNSPLFSAAYRGFQNIVQYLTPITDLKLQETVQQQLEEI
ncbi:ankyrin repeat domain-containing protein [Trichocoleus sp. FACHB-262]|uniref:ankyrin repeat domain-containing protein n=1 Tax=Trichocoleus sp. FACHB-262 TaxID=2692869 RepID=UPI001684D628|nr:ankyrin repeat domain-containing protein [Trichocoleus sp. FACHB-262]MBD2121511.1 ankyrin repeat domain-containing protein [Trichocoleus sp. FACHB-262]